MATTRSSIDFIRGRLAETSPACLSREEVIARIDFLLDKALAAATPGALPPPPCSPRRAEIIARLQALIDKALPAHG